MNGSQVVRPELICSVESSLPTIAANPEGELIKTTRKTTLDVYQRATEADCIVYELGVPVTSIEHPFHLDVRQKVPLSTDRNSLTLGYIRKLCAAVLDGVYPHLDQEQARSRGISEGIALAENDAAVQAVMGKQHGANRLVPDPNNREATGELTARGYVSVAPGSYDKQTWQRIREAKAVPNGSELMPKRTVASKPYVGSLTNGMRAVQQLAEMICSKVLGKQLSVKFSGNADVTCIAQCGPADDGVQLTFHVHKLGVDWFSEEPAFCRENLDLIFHELGHHKGDQDCTREHCNQVTFIAASVAIMMMTDPASFAGFHA